jgi:hypothetical protein
MPIVDSAEGFRINAPCPFCLDSGLKPVLMTLVLPSPPRTSIIRRNVIANLFCGQCNRNFAASDNGKTKDEILKMQVETFQRRGRRPKHCPKCKKRLKEKGSCIPTWMELIRIADGRGYAPRSEYERKFIFCGSCYHVAWVIPAPVEPSSTRRFLMGE